MIVCTTYTKWNLHLLRDCHNLHTNKISRFATVTKQTLYLHTFIAYFHRFLLIYARYNIATNLTYLDVLMRSKLSSHHTFPPKTKCALLHSSRMLRLCAQSIYIAIWRRKNCNYIEKSLSNWTNTWRVFYTHIQRYMQQTDINICTARSTTTRSDEDVVLYWTNLSVLDVTDGCIARDDTYGFERFTATKVTSKNT